MEQTHDPANHCWLLGSLASLTVAEPPSSELYNPALHFIPALDMHRAQEEALTCLHTIQNDPPTQSLVRYMRTQAPVERSPSIEVVSSSFVAPIQAADNLTMNTGAECLPAAELSISIPDSSSVFVSDSLFSAACFTDPSPIMPPAAPSLAGLVASSFHQLREPIPSVRSTPSPEDVDVSLPPTHTSPCQEAPSGDYFLGVAPSDGPEDCTPSKGKDDNPITVSSSSGSTPCPTQTNFPRASLTPLRVFILSQVTQGEREAVETLLTEGSIAALVPSALVEEAEEAVHLALSEVNMAAEGYSPYFLREEICLEGNTFSVASEPLK
jgi:hypothetical protein